MLYEICYEFCDTAMVCAAMRTGYVPGIVFCVGAVLFIGICIWQQVTWKRGREYRLRNEAYERYLSQQEAHIHMLVLQDEKMRRFRHDFQAHTIALRVIAEKGDWEELRKYIRTMQQESALDSVERYTGVAAVDAVVAEWARRAKEKAVAIAWEGRLPLSDRVEVFDLCTIFSNLLSNALEACEHLEKDRRRIEVHICCYESYTLLTVRNTYDDAGGRAFSLKSRKGDAYHHGLGVRNVRDALKKYGGELNYTAEEGWVTAEVSL